MLTKEEREKEIKQEIRDSFGKPFNFEKLVCYKDNDGALEKPFLGAKTGIAAGYVTAFLKITAMPGKMLPLEVIGAGSSYMLKGAAAGFFYGISVTSLSTIRGDKNDVKNHFLAGAATTLFVYGKPFIYNKFLKAVVFGLFCGLFKASCLEGWNFSKSFVEPKFIDANIRVRRKEIQFAEYLKLPTDYFKPHFEHLEKHL